MIITGSTSVHLGWNTGRNLAVAANFLDQFSIDIILRDIMDGEVAPWPCACGNPPVPRTARVDGTTMNLPRHRYTDGLANDAGSIIFGWINAIVPFIRADSEYLETNPGRFARVWRYLHEFDDDEDDEQVVGGDLVDSMSSSEDSMAHDDYSA
jgi:hypothetical protein